LQNLFHSFSNNVLKHMAVKLESLIVKMKISFLSAFTDKKCEDDINTIFAPLQSNSAERVTTMYKVTNVIFTFHNLANAGIFLKEFILITKQLLWLKLSFIQVCRLLLLKS